MKVIVTGGAGFIGSALVWALNGRGVDDILVVDRLGKSEKWRNLASLRFADYLEADQFLERMETLSKPDLILHMGACSATTQQDVSYLIRNNFQYTQKVAAWSMSRGARFVYASSAATYGDGSAGMSDEGELSKLRPLNAYGYSKQLFDLYAEREGWLEKMVGLKYFNVFGPNENHKADMRSVVHKAFEQNRKTGAVQLFRSHRPEWKDGEQQRDFLYVKDAVEMTLHLADHPEANGLFNVGSGRASTWLELTAPLEARIEFIDMPEALKDKYQYHTQADISKLRRSGYDRPLTPLQEAVRETLRYLSSDLRLGDEAKNGYSAQPTASSTSA